MPHLPRASALLVLVLCFGPWISKWSYRAIKRAKSPWKLEKKLGIHCSVCCLRLPPAAGGKPLHCCQLLEAQSWRHRARRHKACRHRAFRAPPLRCLRGDRSSARVRGRRGWTLTSIPLHARAGVGADTHCDLDTPTHGQARPLPSPSSGGKKTKQYCVQFF